MLELIKRILEWLCERARVCRFATTSKKVNQLVCALEWEHIAVNDTPHTHTTRPQTNAEHPRNPAMAVLSAQTKITVCTYTTHLTF